MPASPASPLLAHLVDDYVAWLIAWHRLAPLVGSARADAAETTAPPESFIRWHAEALKASRDQTAVEKIATLREQLHTLARLVLIKTPEPLPISKKDDDSILAKYRDLMHALRRLERAFAAADAQLDPLTGLHSRASLQAEIERERHRFVRTGRPFCVAIMDIDHFKKINDTHGHDAGDRVLASVADHISRSLRAHDDAYRLGGEEFLICLKEAAPEDGLRVIERLRASLVKAPIALPAGAPINVTASFGLAASLKGQTPDDLLRRADRALYRAKHEGRDRIVVAEG